MASTTVQYIPASAQFAVAHPTLGTKFMTLAQAERVLDHGTLKFFHHAQQSPSQSIAIDNQTNARGLRGRNYGAYAR